MTFDNFGLTKQEISIFRRLNTPKKIQDFLETFPVDFEVRCRSPRHVLKDKKAACLEGAIFSASALYLNGEPPLLVQLTSSMDDLDHILAVFRQNGKWGAITKTNYAVLRYREPVYRDIRELAMSFFHEYFIDSGKKTLRSFTAKPLDLRRFDRKKWITSKDELWYIEDALNLSRHVDILNKKTLLVLRKADDIEIEAGKLKIWKNKN